MCRITGVQPFGFFATVVDFGGDGLVPVSTIGDEYFRYDEKAQQLVGEETGDDLPPGAEAEAADRRGRPRLGLAALRAAGPASGGRASAAGAPRPRPNDRPSRPAAQHPPSVAAPLIDSSQPFARGAD